MESTIGFNIVGIRTEQFAKFEGIFKEDHQINLKTNLQFKLSQSKNQISVYLAFTYEQKKKVFLTIEVSCHFAVDPESWTKLCKDDGIIFPKNFITHLSMLTVGTTRGVLHEKTINTEFNNFIIPLIDVTQLVKKDVEFILNK